MPVKNKYYVIGLMSGSSLDGLDICYVEFNVHGSQSTDGYQPLTIDHQILKTECIGYDEVFRSKLKNTVNISAFEFAQLHAELGKYFGALTRDFIRKNNIPQPDLVSSHGQTIFHQPGKGFTAQIGCGAQIAAQTNCKVVCDLRSSDIAYGGQGAPIVPVAEKYLFPGHKAFLNLGGIANISFHRSESEDESESDIVAYDVCACNTLLNYFAQQKGMEYDADGKLARSGTVIPQLLDELNAVEFCKQPSPKSLGTEHILNEWIPLFENYENASEDKLATAVEHIAMQIQNAISHRPSAMDHRLLITGGGALNSFLVERINHHLSIPADIPDRSSIQFKEALAMAFIGLLRVLEIPNCLASVTGAGKNVIGGAIYLP